MKIDNSRLVSDEMLAQFDGSLPLPDLFREDTVPTKQLLRAIQVWLFLGKIRLLKSDPTGNVYAYLPAYIPPGCDRSIVKNLVAVLNLERKETPTLRWRELTTFLQISTTLPDMNSSLRLRAEDVVAEVGPSMNKP